MRLKSLRTPGEEFRVMFHVRPSFGTGESTLPYIGEVSVYKNSLERPLY